MDPAVETELQRLRAALEQRDVETIARAYAADLTNGLERLTPGRVSVPPETPEPIQDWLMLIWDGDYPDSVKELDAELWFDLVVATAEAVEEDSAIWCVGDGPADHLVGRHPELADRFHELRRTHPRVEAMFRAMQDDYASMGYPDAGWWTDRP